MEAPRTSTLRAHDGLALAAYRWPLEQPRAACVLVHGYAEHVGRYGAVVEALAGAGVETFAIDLRGHGRSGGVRADVRDFDDYVRDVLLLHGQAKGERPDLPVLVLGHSMGGTIALRFAVEHPGALDALVLSGPFLRPSAPPPAWLVGVSGLLARVAPQLPVQPLDAAAVSRDPAVVEAYRADPLVYTGRIKARMGHALVTAGEPLLERAGEVGVPTLIIHGGADALADPHGSEELAERIPGDLATLRVYPGGYHEQLNDLERERVTADILDWTERLPELQAGSTRNTRNLR